MDEIGVRRFALLVDALGADVDAATLAQTYEAMLADACHFMPGAEALLAALAPRYRLHLVTNGMASVQYDRIRRAGHRSLFRPSLRLQRHRRSETARRLFRRLLRRDP